jgi:hypothetical protein
MAAHVCPVGQARRKRRKPANTESRGASRSDGAESRWGAEDWRFRWSPRRRFREHPDELAGVQIGQQWDPAAGTKPQANSASLTVRQHRCACRGDPSLGESIRHQKADTDAGSRRACAYFGEFQPPAGPATWQGNSRAAWELSGARRGGPPAGGTLKVATSGVRAGYLRKNGYPYSDKTTVTEYYDQTKEANGDTWVIITTIVNDPVYLNQEFITSTHFKKQADATGWNPQPCTAR